MKPVNPPTYAQIYDFANLADAAKKAMKGRWRYRREQAHFRANFGRNLLKIQHRLQTRNYRPLPYRTFYVHDPKKRLICAAPFPDRLVHHAVMNVIGPCLERSLIEHSYACRKNKGTHLAINYAQQNMRRFRYYIHFDVVKFFDSIRHVVLQDMLAKHIADIDIMEILRRIISHSAPGMPPGQSVPIGNLTSQHFGNFYLNRLDHFVKDQMAVKGFLRYMDNFVLFNDSKEHLQQMRDAVVIFCREKLFLELTHDHVHPCYSGLPFLGLRIFSQTIRIQQASLRRFKNKFRKRQRQITEGQISQDEFLLSTAAMVNNLMRADTYHFRRHFFEKYAMNF